jgi:hypothetical protein
MHSFVQRFATSRATFWGGLALLGALTLPVSTSFAQEYYDPSYGSGYPEYPDYQGAPARVAPPVVVAPPAVVYAPEYRRPEWRWGWRHWRRHHYAPRYYHERYYRR